MSLLSIIQYRWTWIWRTTVRRTFVYDWWYAWSQSHAYQVCVICIWRILHMTDQFSWSHWVCHIQVHLYFNNAYNDTAHLILLNFGLSTLLCSLINGVWRQVNFTLISTVYMTDLFWSWSKNWNVWMQIHHRSRQQFQENKYNPFNAETTFV